MRYVILVFVLMAAYLRGDDPLKHAWVSLYAVNMETGEVVADENSNKSLNPGSCIKVVTTAAALHLLGPQAQFETRLEYDGNLVIHGGGDPCLGSDRTSSWKKQIEIWADAFEKLGIRTIKGDVIGDATLWEKAAAPPSWAFEDLGNYYGAGASALSFHENSYTLFFKPDSRVGEPAAVLRTEPPILELVPDHENLSHFGCVKASGFNDRKASCIELILRALRSLNRESFHVSPNVKDFRGRALVLQNEVKTGAEGSGDRACIYGVEFCPQQTIRGTIPAGVQEFSIKGSIPDPAAYCARLLSQELQSRGIIIQHQKITSPEKIITVHVTTSPHVSEIVYWANQKSINLYAEHLLKKMGEKVYHEGSTSAGVQAVCEFLKSEHIDLGGFHMADGSGLSRKNLTTTQQLVAILLKMKKSEHFPLFFNSLPARGSSIRAKTGSMSLIRGYCGYAGNIAFAIIINQCTDPHTIKERIDSFLTQLLLE